MLKKTPKAVSRKKPTPETLSAERKFRPAKATSRYGSKKKLYKGTKPGTVIIGVEGQKIDDLKTFRQQKLDKVARTREGKALAREYLRFQKVPQLEAELFREVRTELSSGGRTMAPAARILLKERVREASAYLKTKGSDGDVERAKVLLQIFAQSFPIVSTPISAAAMQRNMKRWLPCPPFCKER